MSFLMISMMSIMIPRASVSANRIMGCQQMDIKAQAKTYLQDSSLDRNTYYAGRPCLLGFVLCSI